MTQAQPLATTIMLSGDQPPRHFDSFIDMATGRCWKMRKQAVIAYLGRDPAHEVVSEDGTVSRQQALVVRERSGAWNITHMGRPPTYVNGVPVPRRPVYVPLHLGAVVRAGRTVWVCADSTQAQPEHWYICARSEREFYRAALMLYGNLSRAAEGIGVKRMTFIDRLEKWAKQGDREADTVLKNARAGEYSRDRCVRVPMPVIFEVMRSIQARLAAMVIKSP